MKKYRLPIIVIFAVIILDQAFKILIKTNMMLGQEYMVLGKWFRLHFTENNGMAFGLEIAGSYGKKILSIFRIIAIGLIIWYLLDLIHKNVPKGLIISISLILAGALGNGIDS
ncbi:MAG: signal peptidase II, partial [Bacteroidales bacterium]|nr:signal peptidase II [Bacteroidales bacterium]